VNPSAAAPAATPSAPAPAAAAPATAPAAATPAAPAAPAAAAAPAVPAAAPAAAAPGFSVKLPQGQEASYTGLVEMMKAAGFSSEHAQRLVDYSQQQMAAQKTAAEAADKAAAEKFRSEYANDPEIGGPRTQETDALVQRGEAAKILGPRMTAFYESEVIPGTGLKFKDTLPGKELMRAIGKMVSPDNIAGALRTTPGAESKSQFSNEFRESLKRL
jgi:hypothetical protein